MATVKKILGDYTIQSVGAQDNINVNTNTLTINGNLFVTGNSQQVVSTNSAITDHLIILNHGLSLTSPPNPLGAAIEVDRGTAANVQLRWNETVQNWQITNDGTTYSNIAVSAASGGLQVIGNLDLKQYTIYTSTQSQITLDSNLAIKNSTVAPSAAAGYNTIYTTTPPTTSPRDSGVFVTNTTKQGAQLSTKNQALLYSLIFF
jgi:hypothetical protein